MRLYLQSKYQILISIILVVCIFCLTAVLMWISDQVAIEVHEESEKVMNEAMMQQVEERGLAMARGLSSNLVNPLYEYKIEAIYRLLDNALTNKDVLSVIVFDKAGTIQHDGTQEIQRFGEYIGNVADSLRFKSIDDYYSVVQAGQLTIYHPIMIGAQLLGGVSLTISLESVQQKRTALGRTLHTINGKGRKTQLITVISAAVIALVFALLLGAILARYLVHPITQLVQATKRIGKGDYHLKLSLQRKDELGELADSFNSMAHNLLVHQQEVQHIAYHDALTQLPNRLMMKQMLNRAIDETLQCNTLMALMFIDLDDFKQINDTLGHDAGDLLLKHVADRISHELRGEQDLVIRGEQGNSVEQKMVSRLGGDEFTVLVTDLHSEKDAAAIAGRIIDSLKTPFIIDDKIATIGASIGITICPKDGEDSEVLSKNADLAMYQAKYNGKNTYSFYSKQFSTQVEQRAQVKEELLSGLKKDEFELYYQPQVQLIDCSTVGCEALIRWIHPVRGRILPNEFIPVAEESGLIDEVDNWVLESAFKKLREWESKKEINLYIGVNLSPQQLADKQLPQKLDNLSAHYPIDPAKVHLEVTETMLIKDEFNAAAILDDVAKMGFPLWLDDFGTGFSSLSHLQKFPLNGIKIDRKFTQNLSKNKRDQKLVRALVTLGSMLGLKVIAEGVETEQQAQLLRQWGCQYGQGYLYSEPMKEEKLQETFYNANHSLEK